MIRIANRPRRRFEINSDSDKAPIEISSDGNDELDKEIIIIILPIEKHMQSKTMVLYPPCY